MSGKKVVVDTDILSMFAKVDAVDVLESLLGKKRMVMTPAIRDEIAVPLQYGYTFPRRVLDRVPVASLSEQVQQEYEQLWLQNPLWERENWRRLLSVRQKGRFSLPMTTQRGIMPKDKA